MARCGHDLEVVMAILSPVVNGRMPKVVKVEIINSRILANRLVCPSDMFGVNGLSIPMKDTVKVQRSHFQGFLKHFHQLWMNWNCPPMIRLGIFGFQPDEPFLKAWE